jgi:hypothetical protein
LTGLTEDIGRKISSLGGMQVDKLTKNMDASLADLSTKIIMPAGDVFMFDGLNTDANNNVYSGVKYSSLSGGEVITGKKGEATV